MEGFGDWHELGTTKPKDVLDLSCFTRSAGSMAEVPRSLGRPADAARYTRRGAK